MSEAGERRFSVGEHMERWEWYALVLVVVVFLVVATLIVRSGAPLGWDESVYALRTEAFHEGVAAGNTWQSYRAPGLPWVAHLLWLEGPTVAYLRMVVVGFGLLLVLVTWVLARYLFGRRAGVVAAGGLALTPALLGSATQFWPDVPGAAVGFAALAVFVFATHGRRASWWILAVPVLVVAATFMRFGATVSMFVGFVGIAVWRRRVLLRSLLPIGIAGIFSVAGVAAVLFVPWLTGSEVSPFSARTARVRSLFEGFSDYLGVSKDLIGSAAVVIAVVGVVLGILWARRGDIDAGAFLTALGIGLGMFVVLATVLHGEVRYLSPVLPWLWVAASPGLDRGCEPLPGVARPAVAVVLVLVLAVAGIEYGRERNRDSNKALSVVRQAALQIAEDADGRDCLVIANRVGQVRWYSGCRTRAFNTNKLVLPEPGDEVVYMLLVEADRRQPEGELRDAYVAEAEDLLFTLKQGWRDAEVYLIYEPTSSG
jgi:hypothetical protein